MNLDTFKSLTKKFENKNFEKDNNAIDKTLYYSSWFGNLLSVIFAFFFINSLISQAATHFAGQGIILPIFIVLFLTMFELLKRFVFGNVTVTLLTMKKATTKVVMGVLFALLLVSGSFYLSMSGAQHYVNKNEIITTNTDSLITENIQQIKAESTVEIGKVEQKIQYVYEAAQTRKKVALTRDEIKDIKQWEQEIKILKQDADRKIELTKQDVKLQQDSKLEKSNKSQLAFLLLSFFIELLICIGVGYRQYYMFASYKQMKESIEGNPNFKKLELYKQMMQVLFNNGKTVVNAELPSYNKFAELINAKTRIKVSTITIKEFLSVMTHLNIIYISGKKRYTQVSYEKALETLNNYIPLENE